MKKLFFILMIISTALLSQQLSKEPSLLTLEQAINLALEKNSELKIAKMEIKKSEKKLLETQSGLFPQLSVAGQYQRNIDMPVIFLPPGTPFGQTLKIGMDNAFVASMSVSLPLFSWSLYKGIGMASEALKISRFSYNYTKNKVITDVKKAFLTALLARETKNVMQQSLKNAQDNFENVRRLRLAGTLSDYDVLRAEVQVENLKPVVLQMENNYQLALDNLKITIGLDASKNIEVADEINFDESYQLPSKEEIIDMVTKNNPQIAILEKQVEVNKTNVALERSAYLPTFAAYGGYQYQTQANDDVKFSDYRWVRSSMIGLQLQIPIFNGFKTYARVSQAEIGLDQTIQQKETATEAIKTQTLSILFRMEQAIKRIQGQNKTVSQATEGYEIAKKRLETGLATQLEVNDAELSLRQAKLNRLQAIYDFKIAEAELENVLGKNK